MTAQKWIVHLRPDIEQVRDELTEMRYDPDTQKFAITVKKGDYVYCEKENAAEELDEFLATNAVQEP